MQSAKRVESSNIQQIPDILLSNLNKKLQKKLKSIKDQTVETENFEFESSSTQRTILIPRNSTTVEYKVEKMIQVDSLELVLAEN